MHPPFARRTRLAGHFDRLGIGFLTVLFGVGFFYFLWRDFPCALPAGLALAVMMLLTFRLLEKSTLPARQAAMRRKLGGEMALDSLLMKSGEDAAEQAAAWLSLSLEDKLCDMQRRPGGILARCGEETVWIACLQKHPGGTAGADDVLREVRCAIREHAQVCIICATCAFSQQAMALSEEMQPRTKLLGRAILCALAGNAAPATDEQLRLLGRRKRKFHLSLWKSRILSREKGRRYAAYALVLFVFYLIFRKIIYLLPAMACFVLFCLFLGRKKEKIRL